MPALTSNSLFNSNAYSSSSTKTTRSLLLFLLLYSLFFFPFAFYYHLSSVSRGFMRRTRPYTLPILHSFSFFSRSSTFTIFPRWETSAGSNMFRVRGPWVRLINTKRPDRLVLSRRRLSPRLFSLFLLLSSLARLREISDDHSCFDFLLVWQKYFIAVCVEFSNII